MTSAAVPDPFAAAANSVWDFSEILPRDLDSGTDREGLDCGVGESCELPTEPVGDLLAVGGDLNVATVLSAYLHGIFPMGVGEGGTGDIGWWCPQRRGVLRSGDLRISRSLRKSARRFTLTYDAEFSAIIRACADPMRDGAWITPQIIDTYEQLHRLGFAHSVEVWSQGQLAGGLYGLSLGGLFAGESMFHWQRDASKVALIGLCAKVYSDDRPRLIDMQWLTDHLASLGGIDVSRRAYLDALPQVLAAPAIEWGVGS